MCLKRLNIDYDNWSQSRAQTVFTCVGSECSDDSLTDFDCGGNGDSGGQTPHSHSLPYHTIRTIALLRHWKTCTHESTSNTYRYHPCFPSVLSVASVSHDCLTLSAVNEAVSLLMIRECALSGTARAQAEPSRKHSQRTDRAAIAQTSHSRSPPLRAESSSCRFTSLTDIACAVNTVTTISSGIKKPKNDSFICDVTDDRLKRYEEALEPTIATEAHQQ